MSSSPSVQEIASAALSLWDMNAEEVENELALKVAIARGLTDMGISTETAAFAAALVDKALNAHEFPDRPVDEAIAQLPLYQALVAEIQSAGYGYD